MRVGLRIKGMWKKPNKVRGRWSARVRGFSPLFPSLRLCFSAADPAELLACLWPGLFCTGPVRFSDLPPIHSLFMKRESRFSAPARMHSPPFSAAECAAKRSSAELSAAERGPPSVCSVLPWRAGGRKWSRPKLRRNEADGRRPKRPLHVLLMPVTPKSPPEGEGKASEKRGRVSSLSRRRSGLLHSLAGHGTEAQGWVRPRGVPFRGSGAGIPSRVYSGNEVRCRHCLLRTTCNRVKRAAFRSAAPGAPAGTHGRAAPLRPFLR